MTWVTGGKIFARPPVDARPTSGERSTDYRSRIPAAEPRFNRECGLTRASLTTACQNHVRSWRPELVARRRRSLSEGRRCAISWIGR